MLVPVFDLSFCLVFVLSRVCVAEREVEKEDPLLAPAFVVFLDLLVLPNSF